MLKPSMVCKSGFGSLRVHLKVCQVYQVYQHQNSRTHDYQTKKAATMGDVKDMLGLQPSAASSPAAASSGGGAGGGAGAGAGAGAGVGLGTATKPKPRRKKPKGMSREVYALYGDDDELPPIVRSLGYSYSDTTKAGLLTVVTLSCAMADANA